MISVITRSQFPSPQIKRFEELTHWSVPIFKKQNVFISLDIKRDFNDSGTISSFKWESMQDHEICMKSEDWYDLNTEWEAWMNQEDVSLEYVFMEFDWKFVD